MKINFDLEDKFWLDHFMRLNRDFYSANALKLAPRLIGKKLVRIIGGKKLTARIVETEAYYGPEDKACHAYRNRRTKRTEVMYYPGGYSYVYLIYGMYCCLNIVCGPPESPQAVLIRAVEPLNNIDVFMKNRKGNAAKLQMANLTNGPGKLCQAMNIDHKLNGLDLIKNTDLYILNGNSPPKLVSAPRVNINYAQEYCNKLWRWYDPESIFVSVKKKNKCTQNYKPSIT